MTRHRFSQLQTMRKIRRLPRSASSFPFRFSPQRY
ncbi:hypothetical protein JOD01_003379 [Brevibacillus fulvus]|uniref:Uncharacterized protein n=1 Tax=Brevibacillus fulvus TaxID=1125967 RepID=A0A938XWE3_9BACL|nr:hypothetical protein [Brevibacillus fulvus]